MVKTVSTFEIKKRIEEFLTLVYFERVKLIIEKEGKPMAMIVPMESPLDKNKKRFDLRKFFGIWKDEKIEKEMRRFRKKFKVLS